MSVASGNTNGDVFVDLWWNRVEDGAEVGLMDPTAKSQTSFETRCRSAYIKSGEKRNSCETRPKKRPKKLKKRNSCESRADFRNYFFYTMYRIPSLPSVAALGIRCKTLFWT